MTETIVVGDLTLALRRGSRRTIGITIERDGGLIVAAPDDCDFATIEAAVRQKHLWIHTKLARKELLSPQQSAKELVPGEGFFYLGRSFRLRLVDETNGDGAKPPLRLHHGYFELRRSEQERGREQFVRWYREHARPWIERRVGLLGQRIGAQPDATRIRDLGHRWGSCTADGVLNFHWRTMLLPPSSIEYVIAHELVHLHERRHTPAFWARLARAIPDFDSRKHWLAENGARFDL